MGDIAIRAEHLSKMYRLGVINNGTLWKDIQTWVALKTGREDPHSKIGEDKYSGDEDHFWALKDLNFEIKQGDRVGIIGKNGAGKSTLLKILSRITSPMEGTIKIRGKIASLLEVGTGFHAELTGRENIYLNGAILGMKKRQIDRKLDEIIAFSEIEHYIDTPVKRYSSGMYVRLAFAVAAHLDSDILIADEVLAVGDAAFQKKAIGKMHALSSGQGRTVLFVSHNMGAVAGLCTSGILLQSGRIIFNGGLNPCIEAYLKPEGKAQEEGVWNGNEGDENLRLRYASLSLAGEVKGKYLRGEKAVLNIRYEILISNKNYVFCVEIINSQGSVLCESSANEALYENIDALSERGDHSISLEIDTSILAQGRYSVRFDFAIRNQKRIIQDIPTIGLRVEDCENSDGSFVPKRYDCVSPKWKWGIVQ